MITIILNGKNKQLDSNTSIIQLLENLDLSEKRLAVELNKQIVPRSDFTSVILNKQDQIEIVQAIGGGSLQPNIRPHFVAKYSGSIKKSRKIRPAF